MIKYVYIVVCKISGKDRVGFDQYLYVSIDFVLNTQIENQTRKLIFFREILQTAV